MSKVILFGGGGARGAFQAGVYEKLMRDGYKPDAVAGISVGALNGAMVATGKASNLTPVWRNISPGQVLKKRGMVRSAGEFLLHKVGVHKPKLGFYSNEPLETLIMRNLGQRFETDYYCGSVNLKNGWYIEHRAIRGNVPWNFVSSVLASTAIPVVFDPVNIKGDYHVDGGVRHMSPLGRILSDHNPSEIIIVLCNRYRDSRQEYKTPKDIIDVGKYSLDIMMREIFEKDLRQFERLNQLVRQAEEQGYKLKRPNGKEYKEYKAYLYQPHESLGDSLDFSSKQARRNIEIGLNAVPIEL